MKTIKNPEPPCVRGMSAVAVASMVLGLVNFVLLTALAVPRLYGMDPLGLEQRLKSSSFNEDDNDSIKQGTGFNPENSALQDVHSSLRTVAPAIDSMAQTAADPYAEQHEVVTLVVPPGQNLNYWLSMERDSELDYRWSTDGKELSAELRGERADAEPGDHKIFVKSTRSKAGGLFIAPFSGRFGWHWVNTSNSPITVKLMAKGEFQVPGKAGRR